MCDSQIQIFKSIPRKSPPRKVKIIGGLIAAIDSFYITIYQSSCEIFHSLLLGCDFSAFEAICKDDVNIVYAAGTNESIIRYEFTASFDKDRMKRELVQLPYRSISLIEAQEMYSFFAVADLFYLVQYSQSHLRVIHKFEDIISDISYDQSSGILAVALRHGIIYTVDTKNDHAISKIENTERTIIKIGICSFSGKRQIVAVFAEGFIILDLSDGTFRSTLFPSAVENVSFDIKDKTRFIGWNSSGTLIIQSPEKQISCTLERNIIDASLSEKELVIAYANSIVKYNILS